MRKIDNNGLILCDLQSELFEQSINLDCSTEIFIRRFMNSNIVKYFDQGQILDDTLTTNDIFDKLEEEYGSSNYGRVKYSKNELYWIGHLYRYFAYTYQLSSRQIYKIIKPKELKCLFRAYHTLDTPHAIERILEAKNINLNVDYTEKGLEILRRIVNNQMTYYKELNNNNFLKIKEDSKIIELELKDDKLSKIKKNDVIIFKDLSTRTNLKTKVVEIMFFETVETLYNYHLNLANEYELKLEELLEKYSKEEVNRTGLIGLMLQKI